MSEATLRHLNPLDHQDRTTLEVTYGFLPIKYHWIGHISDCATFLYGVSMGMKSINIDWSSLSKGPSNVSPVGSDHP